MSVPFLLTSTGGGFKLPTGWSIAGSTLTIPGATSGTVTIAAPAVSGTRTNPIAVSNVLGLPDGAAATAAYGFTNAANTGISRGGSGELVLASGGITGLSVLTTGVSMAAGKALAWTNGAADLGLSRLGAGLLGVGNGTAADISGIIIGGNSSFVASDFTTAANTNLQTITGLSITVPAVAAKYKFHAHLAYSIATAAVAVAFGIQAATNNPTNIFATGRQQITVGPPATFAAGTLATLATTTATAIVSGTPGAINTNYEVDIYGTIENPASGNTINLCVSTATAADVVTVRRGSYISFNV